jgi:hypothetical protein
MVLFILTFTFVGSRWEGETLWTAWQQALPKFSLLLLSSCLQTFYNNQFYFNVMFPLLCRFSGAPAPELSMFIRALLRLWSVH